jgi:hypothetical protein
MAMPIISVPECIWIESAAGIESPYIDITHCFKQMPAGYAVELVGPLSFCAMMQRLEVPCGVLFKA